jgi:hypothetical protein
MRTPISEFRIWERGSRVHRADEGAPAIDHHRADEFGAQRRDIGQFATDRGIRAQLVELGAGFADGLTPLLEVAVDTSCDWSGFVKCRSAMWRR